MNISSAWTKCVWLMIWFWTKNWNVIQWSSQWSLLKLFHREQSSPTPICEFQILAMFLSLLSLSSLYHPPHTRFWGILCYSGLKKLDIPFGGVWVLWDLNIEEKLNLEHKTETILVADSSFRLPDSMAAQWAFSPSVVYVLGTKAICCRFLE